MAVQITHVRFDRYGKTESSIVAYRWLNPADGAIGESDKPSMVSFIEESKGEVYVGTGLAKVNVGVVHPDQGATYLRTYADNKWTNNLVSLPTF